MCGIAGIINTKQIDRSTVLAKMLQSQHHRGPDASDFWESDHVSMGHNRLSIIDLDAKANQPMHSHNNRYVMVFNGEIYNYISIKNALGERNWRTNSDSEVLLEAYVEWGPQCLEKLNGMFAFAIWDKQNQELFIARDRLGIKPIYYAFKDDTLLFASELRTILSTNLIDKNINHQSVHDFLRFQWIQTPNTIIDGIMTIPAGSYALWKNSKFTIEKWWELTDYLSDPSEDIPIDPKEAQKKVRDLFYSAVENRLISDVPIGAFLSGGIDSSAVVAAMANMSSSRVNTFCIGFNEKKYDESDFAEIIAKKYNTNHELLTYSADTIKNDIPEILASFDTPSTDGVNSAVITKLVKDAGITVALSGLGGDELFCGYPVFKQLPALQKYASLWKLPKGIRQSIAKGMSIPKIAKYEKLGRLLSASSSSKNDVYPYFREIFNPELASKVLANKSAQSVFESTLATHTNDPTLGWISTTEISGYTQHVLLKDTDMCSMTHSLEVRVPFFDHNLVEYVLSLPDSLKTPSTPKKLLTDALGADIPYETIHRKKMGFSFPWDVWIRNDLKNFVSETLNKSNQYELFDSNAIQSSWKNYLAGDQTIKWYHIWNLVCLISWMDENLD